MHPFSIAHVTEKHARDIASTVLSFRPSSPRAAHDLFAAAHVGLVQAHAAYDPAITLDFWSFAYRRIRGAILDELRIGARHRTRALRRRDRMHAWDENAIERESPEDLFLREEALATLARELDHLPTRERTVLRGFYFEDRCLDDIAAELGGHSRSWVSRIHTRGLRMLRERISV